MKAMILAAGRGRRMMPLTANTPKPLLMVAGKPLIQHLIEKLAKNEVREIVINYSYLGKQIESFLGNGKKLGVSIQYSPEEELLGTAGGILHALPLLGSDPFILVNSDVWTDYSFKELPVLDGKGCLAHLVMVDNAEHNPDGDFVLNKNNMLSVAHSPREMTLTYSGISTYHPRFFERQLNAVINLPPLLREAMSSNLVSGEYFQGEWVDVGTPERLDAINNSICELG